MNIKYNKKQKEIQEDPVLSGLLKTKEFIQKNKTIITTTGIVIVLILVIGLGYNQFRQTKIAHAREDFGKAMVSYNEKDIDRAESQFIDVANKYRGSTSGTIAAYMLGRIYYDKGEHDQAINWYKKIESAPDIGFVSAEAYEGLSACYEAKGDIDVAKEYLEKAIKDKRTTYRSSALRWKMALLTRETDTLKTIQLCEEIIADTLAQDYGREARYLKEMLTR